jgi:hypothetical protein
VVHLSLQDPRRSIGSPSARLARAVFGLRGTQGLADPRQEALRSYAIRCRTSSLTSRANSVVGCAGTFGPEAVAETRQIVEAHLASQPRSRLNFRRVAGIALAATAALWLYLLLAREFDDPLIAFILVGVAGVTAISFAPLAQGPVPATKIRSLTLQVPRRNCRERWLERIPFNLGHNRMS